MKKTLFLFCTVICAFCLSAEDLHIRGRFSALTFQSDGRFTLTMGKEKVTGALTLRGRDGKVLPVTGSIRGGKCILQGKDFRWELTPQVAGPLFLFAGALVNEGKSDAFLEPSLTLFVSARKLDRHYDGFNLRPASKTAKRKGFKGKTSAHIGGSLNPPFPVSALFDAERLVLLGKPPFDRCSYHASTWCNGELGFSQRQVPGPGRRAECTFVAGLLPMHGKGEENAVQALYDAMPAAFLPAVSPEHWLLRGVNAHYRSWAAKPDLERERRHFASIEWAYAPFKRLGDLGCHEELWDYKQLAKGNGVDFNKRVHGEVLDYDTMTAAEYRKRRAELFLRYGERFGYAFYTCPAWCEKQLAQEKYPDAINPDTEGGLKAEIPQWCTGHDIEVRVFPMGTSYARVLREDIKTIYDTLHVPGFTTDCGTAGACYRGPAVNDPDLPGRAWDEKGLFCDELLSVNELLDYMHSLNPSDPPVTWKNSAGKADVSLIETSFFRPDFRSWMPLTRYNLGMRTVTMHAPQGYMVNETIPNWRSLSRDAFYRELAKLGDHAVLTCFRYGVTVCDRLSDGNPQLLYCMPELLEAIRFGWHPLLAVMTDHGENFLYRARYGSGADSLLFFGNPYEKPMKLHFVTDNRFFTPPDTAPVFVRKMRDRATLENRFEQGNTLFDAELPSRVPVLFEAVASLSPVPEAPVTVSSCKELNRVVYTLQFRNAKPFAVKITPRYLQNFTAPRILLNGRELAGKSAEIPANGKVELVYSSRLFNLTAKELLRFPFCDKLGRPRTEAVVPADPNAAEEREAASFREYFRFTAQHGITPKPAKKAGAWVRFSCGRGEPYGISRDGKKLHVSAPDAKTLRLMREMLCLAMDARFVYYFPFKGEKKNIPQEIIEKFDMTKRLLPLRHCFEAESK